MVVEERVSRRLQLPCGDVHVPEQAEGQHAHHQQGHETEDRPVGEGGRDPVASFARSSRAPWRTRSTRKRRKRWARLSSATGWPTSHSMYCWSRTKGSTAGLWLTAAARAGARIVSSALTLRPLVLLTPSLAAAVELPRRLASTGRALAGVYPMKPLDLARALAEPVLLGKGLLPWTSGHDALLASRLLAESGDAGLRFPEGTPRAPVAAALARTLTALRRGGIAPERLAALAVVAEPESADARRLASLARLYRGFHAALEGRTADPATLFAAAREGLSRARWLEGAEVVVADDLELDPVEIDFVAALAAAHPVRVLKRALPPSLRPESFRGRLAGPRRRGGRVAARPRSRPSHRKASRRRRCDAFARTSSSRRADSRRETTPSSSSPRPGRPRRCARSRVGCSGRPPAACLSRRWAWSCRGPRRTRRSSPTCSSTSAFPTACTPRCPCASGAPLDRSCCSSAAAASSDRR